MASVSPSQAHASHVMQCMEVWGGNQAADNGVTMPGLDAWVYSRPYKGASGGGDVHYVSSCATGRILRLLVADVSGHGESVADAAVALRALMRRYVNFVDQTRFAIALNKAFTELAEGGTFATAVLATYWSPTDYLVVCNAGHPRPLLYRARTKQWDELATPRHNQGAGPEAEDAFVNLPLGVAEPTGYDQFGVRLSRGDLVLLYTDSLIEARGGSGAGADALLGDRGLLELVRQLDPARPETLVADLVARIIEHGGGQPPEDDMTIMLLRHNGVRPAGLFWRGLLAPFRIARSTVERVRDGVKSPAGLPEFSLVNFLGPFVPAVNRLVGRRKARD